MEMEKVESSKSHENGTREDLISQLPDSLLVHILSFLPTHDAVKTVLLRRFGNLWRSVRVLNLNGCFHHQCANDNDDEFMGPKIYIDLERIFSVIICRVSNLHDAGTMDTLRLKFGFVVNLLKPREDIEVWDFAMHEALDWQKATSGHIDKLVAYAINRKVKILDLNFKGCLPVCSWELYVLPNDVFRSNYLTEMRLISCDIESCPKIVDLKVLRVLSLKEVLLSDETMDDILLGCPSLEELKLVYCYGLRTLYCKNPNLKKLMLKLSLIYENQMSSVHVSCPYVKSLKIARWIVGATLLDVSSLIDASISFKSVGGLYTNKYDGAQSLLQMVSPCKTITLCGNTIRMLTLWHFDNVAFASYEWKNVIVKLDNLAKWHHPGLSWLLKSCQSLETLTMYIGPEDLFRSFPHYCDPKSCWDVLQEASFPCLECITIHGYINEPFVDQMLKFLLKNATRLQKIVISVKEVFEAKRCDAKKQYDECSSCQVLKIVHELSVFPRASSQAMICISS